MKLKELPCAVSPAAPREAFLLLQRIEDRKMKRGWWGGGENPPRTMQHNSSDNNTKARSGKRSLPKMRERERERERKREHEAKERLFILSQTRVPRKSGIKIEPIVVNLWSVGLHGKREKGRIIPMSALSLFCQKRKSSPGEGRVLRLTRCLHSADIPLPPRHSRRPPSVNRPKGSVTPSDVNVRSQQCLLAVRCCGCQVFNYQPFPPAPDPTASTLTDLMHMQASTSLAFWRGWGLKQKK